MPKSLEIERRFLCRLTAPPTGDRLTIIEQVYFTRKSPAIRLRVVNGGDRYVLTFKKRRMDGSCDEAEIEIGELDTAMTILGMSPHTVEKRRYDIDRFELDVFDGRHEGLVILEIELDSFSETLPPFPSCVEIIREITHEKGVSNQALAFMDRAEAGLFLERVYQGPLRARLLPRPTDEDADDSPGLSCSFCGKTMRDVQKIVAGPSVYICNECTDLIHAIVHETEEPTT